MPEPEVPEGGPARAPAGEERGRTRAGAATRFEVSAGAEAAARAEVAATAEARVLAPAVPRSRALARRARRLRASRRVLTVALLVVCLLTTGLASSPVLLPFADRATPGPGPAGAPERPEEAVNASRPWPAWATALASGLPTSWQPGSAAGGGVARAASPPPLSTGYRGWANTPPSVILAAPAGREEASPIAAEVRGIYLTAYTAGQAASFRNLVELVDSTALNAMVINIKDEEGRATYDSHVQAFRDAGAVSVQIPDIEGLLRVCKAYGIYTIGRLVTFEDSTLPRFNPDLGVKRPDGSLWHDRNGRGWTDAFRPEVWDYNLALAEEAASLGFDEIQFDYVRFPTDGDTRNMVLSEPSGPDNINRVRAITAFLNYAKQRLAPYGTVVSADVFGIICSTRVDTSLGQVLEDVASAVDYVSPMIYPSHYGPGHFGLPEPDAEPYWTVRGALTDALERLGPGGAAKLRPWLQDFTLYHPYGPEQVLDQIRATHELGIKGWLLWSPSNRYTVAALRAYTVNLDAYLNGETP